VPRDVAEVVAVVVLALQVAPDAVVRPRGVAGDAAHAVAVAEARSDAPRLDRAHSRRKIGLHAAHGIGSPGVEYRRAREGVHLSVVGDGVPRLLDVVSAARE